MFDLRMTWEALGWTAVLFAIAWALYVYQCRLDAREARRSVCEHDECMELAEPHKKLCMEHEKQAQARRIKGDDE